MSTVKVVDLNNEEAKETPEPIEEVKEELPEPEIVNEVVEETNEQPKEEPKEEKPKRQTQKDRIQCPKCFKEMSVKSYRYSHEKNCGGKLSDKPVKPHTNPKPKAKQTPKPKVVPKPPPEVYYSESESDDDEEPQQPLVKKTQRPQKSNPLLDITNHYALLQQQFIQQKQERYNKICQGMFAPRVKKR